MPKSAAVAPKRKLKPTSSDKLAARLQQGIDSGRFVVGNSLPSERELVVKFNVSRTTVREALRILSAQGLIEVKRGRSGGSFISTPSTQAIVRSFDLFIRGQNIRYLDFAAAREAFEPAAAAQAAVTRTESNLERLRLQTIACEELVRNSRRFRAANIDWHQIVAEASENPIFITIQASLSKALHDATDTDIFDEKTNKNAAAIHWRIYNAIRDRDADAARRRMLRHLTAIRTDLKLLKK